MNAAGIYPGRTGFTVNGSGYRDAQMSMTQFAILVEKCYIETGIVISAGGESWRLVSLENYGRWEPVS